MTLEDQILEAVIARLNDGRPTGVPEFEEDLGNDRDESQLPAATVSFFKDLVRESNEAVDRRALGLQVDLWGKADVGPALRAELGPIRQWVKNQLNGWDGPNPEDPAHILHSVKVSEVHWANARLDREFRKETLYVAVDYQQAWGNAAAAG